MDQPKKQFGLVLLFWYSEISEWVLWWSKDAQYQEPRLQNHIFIVWWSIFSSSDCRHEKGYFLYPLLTEDIEWFTFVSFLQYDHVVGISTGSLYCLYVLGVSKQWVFYALQGLLPFPLFALAFRCWCVMWLYVNFWVSYTKNDGYPMLWHFLARHESILVVAFGNVYLC